MKLYQSILLLLGTVSAIQLNEIVQQKQKQKDEPEDDSSEQNIIDLNQKETDSSTDLLEEFRITMAKAREHE